MKLKIMMRQYTRCKYNYQMRFKYKRDICVYSREINVYGVVSVLIWKYMKYSLCLQSFVNNKDERCQ